MGKRAAVAWTQLAAGGFPRPSLHLPVYQTASHCFQHSIWGELAVWMGAHVKERPPYHGAWRVLAADPSRSHSSGLSCPLCCHIPKPTISVRARCFPFGKCYSAKNHLVIFILTSLFQSGALEACRHLQEAAVQAGVVSYAMQGSSTHTKPTWQLVLGFHGHITAQMPKRRGGKKKKI